MDIDDNIYDGRDYLPYQYHSIVQNKYCFPYVLLVNGEIVSISTTPYYRTSTASLMYCWSVVK